MWISLLQSNLQYLRQAEGNICCFLHTGVLNVYLQVYKDQTNVDNYLVNSIVQPTSDPNAGEVYYRYIVLSLL